MNWKTNEVSVLRSMIQNFKVESNQNPKDVVNSLCSLVNDLEDKIAELAIEHSVSASIDGPRGAGRWVVHQNEIDEAEKWSVLQYKVAGEWMTSSEEGC